MTIYDGYTTWNTGEFPTVLAIGDSWFWYPNNNLLEALAQHRNLKDGYQHMVRLGQNGALLSEYVDVDGRPGRFSRKLKELLGRDPMQYISVFALSGAGNDTVDYTLGLHRNCTGRDTPEACISDEGMHGLLRDVTRALGLLMHEVMWAFAAQGRQPIVLLHGYDYPVPDGRGFSLAGLFFSGPWLARAMNACSVAPDLELRTGIARLVIDRMCEAMQRHAAMLGGAYFIDSRGALDCGPGYRKDWANELHPTRPGFRRIVERKWIPVLQQIGIASV
jgi:hypothetical protein